MTSAEPSQAAQAPGKVLRRDSERGMLLGVCAGIARALDADPLLVRAIVIVIGLLTGPLAVIAYVAAAVIAPRDDGRMLLGGSPPDRRESLLGWAGVAFASILLLSSGPALDGLWSDEPFASPLLAIALVAGVFVLVRANRERGAATPVATPAAAPAAPAAPEDAAEAPTAPGTSVVTWRSHAQPTSEMPVPQPPRPPEPRGPSLFLPVAGVITAGAAIVVGVDATGIGDLSAAAVAVALAVGALGCGAAAALGAGLRGRVLTLTLGIVLALSAAATAAIDEQFDDGIGARTIRPATASDLAPEYRLGVGLLELDLRDTQLPDGVTTVKAQVGAGEIQLRVAPDVRIVPAGDTSIDGRLEPLVKTKDGGAAPVLRIDGNVDVGGPVDVIR